MQKYCNYNFFYILTNKFTFVKNFYKEYFELKHNISFPSTYLGWYDSKNQIAPTCNQSVKMKGFKENGWLPCQRWHFISPCTTPSSLFPQLHVSYNYSTPACAENPADALMDNSCYTAANECVCVCVRTGIFVCVCVWLPCLAFALEPSVEFRATVMAMVTLAEVCLRRDSSAELRRTPCHVTPTQGWANFLIGGPQCARQFNRGLYVCWKWTEAKMQPKCTTWFYFLLAVSVDE